MNTDKMVTRKEAASLLGVSMRTLDRYISQGRFATHKYARPHRPSSGPVKISEASLRAYLGSTEVTPAE